MIFLAVKAERDDVYEGSSRGMEEERQGKGSPYEEEGKIVSTFVSSKYLTNIQAKSSNRPLFFSFFFEVISNLAILFAS